MDVGVARDDPPLEVIWVLNVDTILVLNSIRITFPVALTLRDTAFYSIF